MNSRWCCLPDIPGMNGVTLIDAEQPFLAAREYNMSPSPSRSSRIGTSGLVEKAAGYVDVEVEELPAIFTMEDAVARGDIFKSISIENGDLLLRGPVNGPTPI